MESGIDKPVEREVKRRKTEHSATLPKIIWEALNSEDPKIHEYSGLKWFTYGTTFAVNFQIFCAYYCMQAKSKARLESIKNRMTRKKTGFVQLGEVPPPGYDKVYTHISWMTDESLPPQNSQPEPAQPEQPVVPPLNIQPSSILQSPVAAPTNTQPAASPPNIQPMTVPPNTQPVAPHPNNQPVASLPIQPMTAPLNNQPMAVHPNTHLVAAPPNNQPMAVPPNNQPMAALPNNQPMAVPPNTQPVAAPPNNQPMAVPPMTVPPNTQPAAVPSNQPSNDSNNDPMECVDQYVYVKASSDAYSNDNPYSLLNLSYEEFVKRTAIGNTGQCDIEKIVEILKMCYSEQLTINPNVELCNIKILLIAEEPGPDNDKKI
jgi:hypothetical protein